MIEVKNLYKSFDETERLRTLWTAYEVGKTSTDAVVSSSVLILFSDVFLTQLLS